MKNIIRGTTPTLKFTLPFNSDEIEKIYVTFKENEKIVLDKSNEDENVSVDGKTVTITLNQEETLMFTNSKVGTIIYIQARILMKNGTALASNINTVNVSQILKEGVI